MTDAAGKKPSVSHSGTQAFPSCARQMSYNLYTVNIQTFC